MMRGKFKLLLLGFCLSMLPMLGRAALPELFPVEQLKPGLRGQTYTVLQGTEVVPLETEILGVLANGLGPGKDLIIGKLVDEKSRLTGAVHGMSGSPLYIEGKLVGALSRRLVLFEKDGHCGFTPIRDMLDVAQRKKGGSEPDHWPMAFSRLWNQSGSPALPRIKPDMGQHLSIPLSVSGWTEGMLASLSPLFSSMPGVTLVAGSVGSSGVARAKKIPIQPGSALAVVLIDGDIRAGGTGTTTTVDGNQVTAFGHSMIGLGPTELPLAGAEIITTMPSYLVPHKISNMGVVSGTIWQDRLSAVAGEVGRVPAMAQYEISRRHQNENRPSYQGRFVKNDYLAPRVLSILMATALLDEQDFSTEATLKLSGEIHFKGLPKLRLKGLYSGDVGQRITALMDQLFVVEYLYEHFPKQIEVEKLKLSVESYERAAQWTVESMSVRKKKLKRGEKVQAFFRLKNGKGEKKVEEMELQVPEELKGKSVRLRLMGGDQLQRAERNLRGIAGSANPSDYLSSLGAEFDPQAFYLQITTSEAGVMSRNRAQIGLPYSISQVVDGNRYEALLDFSGVHIWAQTEMKLSGVALGSQEIVMEVE
jgi:hypothetical protein